MYNLHRKVFALLLFELMRRDYVSVKCKLVDVLWEDWILFIAIHIFWRIHFNEMPFFACSIAIYCWKGMSVFFHCFIY